MSTQLDLTSNIQLPPEEFIRRVEQRTAERRRDASDLNIIFVGAVLCIYACIWAAIGWWLRGHLG